VRREDADQGRTGELPRVVDCDWVMACIDERKVIDEGEFLVTA
jgi:hypothetical protein